MFGSVVAIGATAARFAAVNARPIGIVVAKNAAATLAVAGAIDAATAVARRRRVVKEELAAREVTVEPKKTMAQSLREARANWKATDKPTRRAIVRRRVRAVGVAVRRIPGAAWRAISSAARWAYRVLRADVFGFATLALAATWIGLYALNAVLMYAITATLGVTAAGLVYVFNRPFSSQADAMLRANRAFLIYEPVYLHVRSLLRAAVLRPLRTARDKWLGRSVSEPAVQTTETYTDEQVNDAASAAFITTHIGAVTTQKIRQAPRKLGAEMFNLVAEYPDMHDQMRASVAAAVDSVIATKGSQITVNHRRQVLIGYDEARRGHAQPQAS